MPMYGRRLFQSIDQFICLTQQTRYFVRSPFPNEISHYLHKAKLIDSIRLGLRSNSPNSLISLLNTPSLDPFVVANAIRSAPSADSALSFVETLKAVPHFSHTQITLSSLAKILARSGRSVELKSLINAINVGKYTNARVSYMDLMQWHAAAGDLESVLHAWDRYRLSNKYTCTEAFNIVMHLYAQMGKNFEAVQIFYRMISEGAIPNSRTYTIIIEHLVSLGKLDSAMEIFKILPLMRIKHTLRQYSVMVEGFTKAKQLDVVKTILNEMKIDGILPGRAMRLSLQNMQEAGFIDGAEEFIREMLPDERIKKIEFCVEGSDEEDEDEDVNQASADVDVVGVQLKPWLDPRALAYALRNWSPNEVAALEEAKFVWTTRLVCKILRNFKSPEVAWRFFCWVAYQPGFTHDIYTIQRMMALLARNGHAELIDKLISKIRREGLRLPFSTIRLIIDFYGISKNADAALKVFYDDKTLCGPMSKFSQMLLYSSLLRTLSKCGRDSDALDVLEEMILSEINPDIQTFSGLMHHFATQGDIKTVQRLFAMVRQSGLEPDGFMFKILIHAYCKCERAPLAWRVFEDMRSCHLLPDADTKKLLVKNLWNEGRRREAAAVEESCEGVNDEPTFALRGHIWTVSSADLARVYSIYSKNLASFSE